MKQMYSLLRLVLLTSLFALLATASQAQGCYADFYVYKAQPAGTMCSPGQATLQAMHFSGDPNTSGMFRWFTSQTSQTPVRSQYVDQFTGLVSNYSLYAQNGTTMWVSFLDYNTGCESGRLSYTFTIIPPVSPGVEYARSCWAGTAEVKLTGAPSGASYRLYKYQNGLYNFIESNSTGLFHVQDFDRVNDRYLYFGQIFQPYGCGNTSYYQLYIDSPDLSQPTVSGQLSLCQGLGTILTATLSGSVSAFRWYDGAGNQIFEGSQYAVPASLAAGTYTYSVRGFRPEGCLTAPRSLAVTINPRPVDSVIRANGQAGSTTILLGQSVTISSTGGSGTPSYWCSSDGRQSWNVFQQAYAGQTSFVHTPQAVGTYVYHVRNATVCGFCWDNGGACGPEQLVQVTVLAPLAPPQVVSNVIMKNLPDSKITAFSCWDGCSGGGHEAWRGRLFNTGGPANWSAQLNDANQFILIDLGTIKPVNAIATQGRFNAPQWVTSYRVAYSINNVNWLEYPQVFVANSDQETVVMNSIAQPFQARYVKIMPVAFNQHISMRAEIISIPPASSDVTFVASQPSGATTNRWYATPSGGVPLHTGTSFSVNLSQNATYYVSSYNPSTSNESLSRTAVVGRVRNANQNHNYIVTNTVMHEGITSAVQVEALNVDKRQKTTTYFDGLGREMQAVAWQASPLGQDIVTPMSYDVLGRVERSYLPYADGADGHYKADALGTGGKQADFYKAANATAYKHVPTTVPWAMTVYEASPLNRVLKQGAPGEAWQPDGQPATISLDHTVKVMQRTNGPREARLWQVTGADLATATYTSASNDNPMGHALQVSGSGSYLQVGNKAPLKMTEAVTVEAWVYPTGAGSNATLGGIIVNKEGEYQMTRYPDGSIGWAFANTSPGWTVWTKTTAVAPLSTWTHVAVTYGEGWVRTYINGVEQHQAPVTGAIGDANPTQHDFRIGGRQNTTASQFFKGAIDEVRVWSAARTAQQIAADMRAASPVGTGLAGHWRMSEGMGTQALDRSPNASHGTLMGTGTVWLQAGFYAPGTLQVTETRDEQDALTVEYKDLQGRVVLKKVQETATVTSSAAEPGFMVTQYVYDDMGNLRIVIQPEGYRAQLPAPGTAGRITLTAIFLDRWCFRYAYDGRRRLVEKQVPGAGKVDVVYNRRDQPVLQRDAEQANKGKWSFIKYDALDRPVMTGELASTADRISLQGQAETHGQQQGKKLFEDRKANDATGYSLNLSFPEVLETDLLTVSYYDDYNYQALTTMPAFIPEAGVNAQAKSILVQGQVTGGKMRVLDAGKTWLTNVTYYDTRYRPIQTVSDGYLNGTKVAQGERTTMRYDFIGQVWETKTTHTKNNGTQGTVVQHMDYDHAGRLLETRQAIDGGAPVVLARQSYNELGQLMDKKLHSRDTLNDDTQRNYLQKVDYGYNIRGWLTHINDGALLGQAGDPSGDLFGLELSYGAGMQLGAGAQFNGNISEMRWSTTTDNKKQRGYAYTYDRANRLTAGAYKAKGTSLWNVDAERYTVNGLTYDANGNIRKLVRRGMRTGDAYNASVARTFGVVDNLTYDYDGNRLAMVNDLETTVVGPAGDFRDNGVRLTYNKIAGDTATAEYLYDLNGNMRRDRNKGLHKVVYNMLNMPEFVYIKEGSVNKGYIRYIYTAGGQKLRKEVYGASGQLTSSTDYAGAFVYESNVLQFAHTSEGRAFYDATKPAGQQWRYEYHLKDHLGNLRVSFAEEVTTSAMATMEMMAAPREESEFGHIQETRHLDRSRSRTGSHAALLGAGRNQPLGPSRRLTVKKGDIVKAEAFGLYEEEVKKNTTFNLASWLLGSATAGVGTMTELGNGKGRALPFLGAGIAVAPQVLQKEKGAPKAYMRYIAYDADSSYLDSGYQLLTRKASGEWEKLELEYTAQGDGFVEVFLANESMEAAWFDDMQVSQTQPMLVQENHYDPWGLNLVGIEKQGAPDHKFQYNGIERQKELGLNWDLAEFRSYDPQLGRFHQIDPVLKFHESPFAWNTNNPILYADPTGADSTQRASAIRKAEEYVKKNPGDSYGFGDKGDPGSAVDCSGLISKSVKAGGEPDPNSGTSNGITNIANNTKEVKESDVVPGNIVILNGNKHGGIIIEVVRGENGNVIGLKMIDSGGTEGPRVSSLIENGKKGYWGNRIEGYRKWDTVPDATSTVRSTSQSQSPRSNTSSSVTSQPKPNQQRSNQQPSRGINSWGDFVREVTRWTNW